MSLPYFKCYTSNALAGTADLTPDELGIYWHIILRLYDEDGPIRDRPDLIARRCNTSTRRCKRILDSLVSYGKIYRADGFIDNKKAENERKKRQNYSQTQAHAASKRWSNESEKPNKINDNGMPSQSGGNADGMPIQNTEYRRQNKYIYSSFFESVWKCFPVTRRNDKKKTYEKLKKAVNSGEIDWDTLLLAAKWTMQTREAKEGYIPLTTTWANQERWRQYVEASDEERSAAQGKSELDYY